MKQLQEVSNHQTVLKESRSKFTCGHFPTLSDLHITLEYNKDLHKVQVGPGAAEKKARLRKGLLVSHPNFKFKKWNLT